MLEPAWARQDALDSETWLDQHKTRGTVIYQDLPHNLAQADSEDAGFNFALGPWLPFAGRGASLLN